MTETQDATESDGFYQSVVDCVMDGIVVIEESGTIVAINPAMREMFGYEDDQLIGADVKILMPEVTSAQHDGYMNNYMTTGIPKIIGIGREDIAKTADGREFPIDLSITEVYYNDKRHFVGVIRDISAQQEAQSIIQDQRRSLLDLSTPALQLFEGIVMMPLIGNIDTERATLMIERLLETITVHQAEVAILDVTGVSVIDTDVARHLLKAVAAAKMLGSDVVLTGIRSTGAQTLVQLGVDLSNVNTKGSLKAGIKEALRLLEQSKG